MIWTKKRVCLATLMVTTGAINTLSTKWADITQSPGYTNQLHSFNHPFLQTCGMFLGECLCLLVYFLIRHIKKNSNEDENAQVQSFSPFIFLPPAICDMVATSLMYFALVLTYASSFQMLRGAVIIFTGLLSVTFLRQILSINKWCGILVIIVGLAMVGITDVIYPEVGASVLFDKNGIIAGDLLIIMAQIIVACQVCYEERFITKFNVDPLQAVGWEGCFGFAILSFLVLFMNYIPSPMYHPSYDDQIYKAPVIEDLRDAFYQIKNSWKISIALIGNVISIAFFNFAGISVTKDMNATTRMVLDSLRTLFIWIFSLTIGWQSFHLLQLSGFLILLIGMGIYDGLLAHIISKFKSYFHNEETQRLLPANL